MTETKSRILVIDDDRDTLQILQFALDSLGYQTKTADDAVLGLQAFGSGEDWDLVLLDQRLPKIEGSELLRRMRALDPMARVIMVTAYPTLELVVEAMEGGVVDFMRKPFSLDVLTGAVNAALAHPREATTVRRTAPRSLNGFELRRVPLPVREEETERLRVRRAFEVGGSSGTSQLCTVDVALFVRELVRLETGRDYPPSDPLWDSICETALADRLWQAAELTPESLLVYDLTSWQLQLARDRAQQEAPG